MSLHGPSLHSPTVWLARACIAAVLLSNLQCAAAFWLNPGAYAPSFQLAGPVGEPMVRAVAVLFVMWNIPYIVALMQPVRYRISLFEAVAMQALGVAGETVIWRMLPAGLPSLSSALARFVIFDGAGLLVLLAAVLLTRRPRGSSLA